MQQLGKLITNDWEYEGVEHTVRQMVRLTVKDARHPVIQRHAERLSASVQQMAERVHEWVRSRTEYRRDPEKVEQLQTPTATLKMRGGDCDDLSMLAAALMHAAGKKVGFRAVAQLKEGQYDHVYMVYRAHGQTRALDPTISTSPGADPHAPRAKSIHTVYLSDMQVNETQKHASALAPPTGNPGLAAPLAEGDSSSGSDKPNWLVALEEIGQTAPDVIDAFKGGQQPSMDELMQKYPGLFETPGTGGGGTGGQQTAGMGTSTLMMVGLGILGAGGIGYAVANS